MKTKFTESQLTKAFKKLLKNYTVKSNLKNPVPGDKKITMVADKFNSAEDMVKFVKSVLSEGKAEKISAEKAKKILYQLKKTDDIFSVQFVKKDGSLRDMNCRFNVKSHLKGGELAYDPKDYDLMSVFDMNAEPKKEGDPKGGYRMINLQTLKKLKANGKSYLIVN